MAAQAGSLTVKEMPAIDGLFHPRDVQRTFAKLAHTGVEQSSLRRLDERTTLQITQGLTDLLLRVHYNGTVPGHRFFDGFAGYQQEANPLWPSLDRDPVTTVENHQRVILRLINGCGFRS